MPFCIRCGNKISDLAVACPKCGTPNALRPQAATVPGVPAAYGNAPALRPLSVGEIIDVAIKLYRQHWRTLLKLVAIVVVPVQIITALILTSATPDTNSLAPPLQPGGTPEFDASAIWTLVISFGATTVLGLLATQLATAASLKAVSDGYLSEEPDWRRSLEFAFKRFGSLVWLALISTFLIGIGFLLCFIPGIYLSVAWSVAIPVLLIENTRGYGALQRSQQLVKGRWWPVVGVLALGRIIAAVLEFVFGGAAALLSLSNESEVVLFATNAISTALSQTLVTPFLAATIAIMYFNLRVRKEGFDLELLAQHVGVTPPGPGGAPAGGPSLMPLDPAPPAPPATRSRRRAVEEPELEPDEPEPPRTAAQGAAATQADASRTQAF